MNFLAAASEASMILMRNHSEFLGGKTGVLDHPLPIFVDHNIFFTIKYMRWSNYFGED